MIWDDPGDLLRSWSLRFLHASPTPVTNRTTCPMLWNQLQEDLDKEQTHVNDKLANTC